MSLEPAARSLLVARRLVSSLLDDQVSAETKAHVQLVTNELVSNAIVHGSSRHEIKLMLELDRGEVDISVQNARRKVGMAETRIHGNDGGRGLRIVAALSRRWRIESGQTGTTVTATVSA